MHVHPYNQDFSIQYSQQLIFPGLILVIILLQHLCIERMSRAVLSVVAVHEEQDRDHNFELTWCCYYPLDNQ